MKWKQATRKSTKNLLLQQNTSGLLAVHSVASRCQAPKCELHLHCGKTHCVENCAPWHCQKTVDNVEIAAQCWLQLFALLSNCLHQLRVAMCSGHVAHLDDCQRAAESLTMPDWLKPSLQQREWQIFLCLHQRVKKESCSEVGEVIQNQEKSFARP